jgi:hypothetical protein
LLDARPDNPTQGTSSTAAGDHALGLGDREKSREESPKWHRARAARLRANGFTKMAEEHDQIAEMIERRRREQENK